MTACPMYTSLLPLVNTLLKHFLLSPAHHVCDGFLPLLGTAIGYLWHLSFSYMIQIGYLYHDHIYQLHLDVS